jgi:hypothetical protein
MLLSYMVSNSVINKLIQTEKDRRTRSYRREADPRPGKQGFGRTAARGTKIEKHEHQGLFLQEWSSRSRKETKQRMGLIMERGYVRS